MILFHSFPLLFSITHYRRTYNNFRLGKSQGAKGETDQFHVEPDMPAVDEALLEEETFFSLAGSITKVCSILGRTRWREREWTCHTSHMCQCDGSFRPRVPTCACWITRSKSKIERHNFNTQFVHSMIRSLASSCCCTCSLARPFTKVVY